MKKPRDAGLFFGLPADQNRDPSTTENRLNQAQMIMPITTVIGKLVLLNRSMTSSE